MKVVAEFAAFVAIASASHLVLFQAVPGGAIATAGDETPARVALSASPPALSALVAEWDRPVEAAQVISGVAQGLQAFDTTPVQLAPAPDQHVTSAPVAPVVAPTDAEGLPHVDQTVPPAPERAVKASVRPRTRPEPQKASAAKRTPAAAPAKRTAAAPASRMKTQGKKAQAAAPAPRQKASPAAMAQWGSSIRSAVERRKRYPSGTRGKGTVTLTVAVSSAGALASVNVRASSGDARLDNAAVTAVRRARFKPAPRGVPGGVHKFSLPVSFHP